MDKIQASSLAYGRDDVSLLDLWQILVRRKALVALVIILWLFVGAGYAFLMPPVFEASVKIRIGQISGGAGLLENGEELATRLLARFGQNVAHGIERKRPYLTRASTQKGASSTLELTVEGDTPDDAADFLKRVVADISAAHDETFQRNLSSLSERLESLSRQRDALQEQYDDATVLLKQLKKQDAVQASFLTLERGRIADSIGKLDDEKPALTQMLIPPQTRPTELLGEITAPADPAKPKKLYAIIAAVIVGVLAGIVLAFVAEFAANARKDVSGST